MAHRTLKRLGYGLGTLALLIIIFIFFFDWNWLRHPIERMVAKKTGRALIIKGNLNVKLGWPLTWVQVADITFANPAWAGQPQMLTVKRIDSSISMARLFKREIWLPTVRLEQPQVFLEIAPDGRKNWLLDRNQKDNKSSPKIGNLIMDSGQVTYLDSALNTHILAQLSTRQTSPDGSGAILVFSATGKFKGLPLEASGSGGQVLALNDQATPYPLNISARLGPTRIQAAGTVTNLAHFSAVDLNLAISGTSLDQLYPLIGMALPRTPKYATKGHLLHNAKQWRYENFIGHVGESDIAGNFTVDQSGKRPFLRGNLTSKLLDLADLGPLIGEKKSVSTSQSASQNPNLSQKTAQADAIKKTHNVLPNIPFRTQRWGSVNADVTIHATRILRAKALPIENLMTRIQMRDSVLTLNPLDFGVAGGTLTGNIILDGQRNPIHAAVLIHARKLLLKKLFPTVKLSQTSIGQINGDFDLSGNGDAIKEMLGTANGKIVLLISSGEISKMLLETAQLHLWEMLEAKLFGDKNIKLNCAIADFNINNGIFQSKILLMDTTITTIVGSGDINMAQETLNIDLKPHTKVVSPVALRSPIYIRGTFAKPDISVSKTDLALQGVGAVALGAINPLLAIVPLVETGPGKKSECGRLVGEAQASRGKINHPAPSKTPKPAISTTTPDLP
ncbi:MAG: AsmA family protein [Sulfuriferula sp.]